MKIKLFCIPYAGGSANAYMGWKRYFDKSIEVRPIELSGRGRRMNSPMYNNIDEVVEDLHRLIESETGKSAYAFFGHSMGSTIVYELSRRISKLSGKEPLHLFVSGSTAPSVKGKDEKIHNLSDDEFKEKIMAYDGTPKEFFENKELSEFFLPILRSDFKIIESYEYIEKDYKLNCNLTAFWGIKDNMVEKDVAEWSNHTNGSFEIYRFDGGHFFINEYIDSITGIINKTLLQYTDCFSKSIPVSC